MESSTALSIPLIEWELVPFRFVAPKMNPHGFFDGDYVLFDTEFGWLRYCPIA